MHCDDKRTIFALNEQLSKAKIEKENLLTTIRNEKTPKIKDELKSKITELEKFILEIENQLSKYR